MDLNTAQNNQSFSDDFSSEINSLEKKLNKFSIPEGLHEEVLRAITRLQRMAKFGSYSSEFETVDKYIDWVTRIPWGVLTQDQFDLENAKKIMDSTHYGMDHIKNLILDYLAVMQLKDRGIGTSPEPVMITNKEFNNPYNVPTVSPTQSSKKSRPPVLLFVGLQGVGKTSIAKSIAKSMGRSFARVSLGAIGDVKTLRGVPRYSPDAEPGQIIKALTRCGSMNPVILLDEIEKASASSGLLNDVMAALLEILDPEQNETFVDHYIDYPVDLSNVFFICTANNLGGLSAALLDRVEVIRFTSYSDEEKAVIATKYILPSVLKETGLNEQHLIIDDNVWPLIIRPVGFDAGIRQLERNIYTMIRSVARKIITGHPVPIRITPENIKEFLIADQGTLS
jgi:ATP-dependent Lon protease